MTGTIVHILSGFPLSMCEIDGLDVGGLTSTASLPSPSFSARLGPLFATSSVSGCRWELWPTSLSSASVPPPPRLLSLLDPSLRLRMPSTNRFFNFLNGFDTESRIPMSVLCRCRIEMMVRWQIAGPRGHKRLPPCRTSSFHKLQQLYTLPIAFALVDARYRVVTESASIALRICSVIKCIGRALPSLAPDILTP